MRRSQAWPLRFSKLPRFLLYSFGFSCLWALEVNRPNDAFSFVHDNQLVGLDVLELVHLAAGPANFEHIHFFGFADSEVHAQVVLRNVAAAAAHFIDLLMWLGLVRRMRDAAQSRADATAVGFGADGAHLEPIASERG